jgi:hypothetical protein
LGTLHEDFRTFHMSDSDICVSTVIQEIFVFSPWQQLQYCILLTREIRSSTVEKEFIFAFPWTQWLHESAKILHYTYIGLSCMQCRFSLKRAYFIKSFICPNNAHLNWFKMLKFTLKFTINYPTCFGLTKPSSGSLRCVLR